MSSATFAASFFVVPRAFHADRWRSDAPLRPLARHRLLNGSRLFCRLGSGLCFGFRGYAFGFCRYPLRLRGDAFRGSFGRGNAFLCAAGKPRKSAGDLTRDAAGS